MSGDPFSQLANWSDNARKTFHQLATSKTSGKTIIVHSQISKSPEEAQKLSEDWKSREEKQLMDNIRRALG